MFLDSGIMYRVVSAGDSIVLSKYGLIQGRCVRQLNDLALSTSLFNAPALLRQQAETRPGMLHLVKLRDP